MEALSRLPVVVVGLITAVAISLVDVERAVAAPQPETTPLRSLAVMAEVIVVVDTLAIKPEQGGLKCRVLEVIHGAGIVAGDEIIVANTTDLDVPNDWIEKTLVYLKYARRPPPPDTSATPLDPRVGFEALSAGFLHRDRSGGVHRQRHNWLSGNKLEMERVADLTWEKLLGDLKRDLQEIAGLRTIQRIDHHPTRNHALFAWIARHRDDMSGEAWNNYLQHDYGPLKYEILPMIMESAIPADCWRAVELAAELKYRFEPHGFAFCTREGRALLVDKALDSSLPEKTRLRALWWLDHRATHHFYRGPTDPPFPTARDIDVEEQAAYRVKLEPLLTHSNDKLRAAAVAAVKEIDFKFDPRQYSFAP